MKRVLLLVALSFLLLAACESETTGKRVAVPSTGPTAAAVADAEPAPAETPEVETKSAAETLKEIQSDPVVAEGDGVKSGNFYPPVTTGATGEDALKEKTKALMSGSQGVEGVQADKTFGPKYHSDDGDAINLPGDYDDEDDR